MTEWITSNWQYILIAVMVAEKLVKLSPSKNDDIILDSIIKPMLNFFKDKMIK